MKRHNADRKEGRLSLAHKLRAEKLRHAIIIDGGFTLS